MDDTIRIREVGPRDGFQNEPETIPTELKVELIDALARTGLRRLEVTSFVRADVIPQLADAEQVLERVSIPEGVAVSVLIPNERGLERALRHRSRFHEINVIVSASETHNRKNVNRSIAESLAGLEVVLARARAEGLRCEAVLSTVFGCPYEGHVPPARVLEIAARLRDAGAQEIGFGDTTGMANPRQVAELFALARERLGAGGGSAAGGVDVAGSEGVAGDDGGAGDDDGGAGHRGASDDGVELTAHFHNTRGAGLANALAALQAGITSFESSFGELGGCPVPAGATGNIATEDLVSMLHEMGYSTGIDLSALIACARRAQAILGRPLGSHTLVAGPVEWDPTSS
jgi:hydroxymethylglutaryl-CoA lyase